MLLMVINSLVQSRIYIRFLRFLSSRVFLILLKSFYRDLEREYRTIFGYSKYRSGYFLLDIYCFGLLYIFNSFKCFSILTYKNNKKRHI